MYRSITIFAPPNHHCMLLINNTIPSESLTAVERESNTINQSLNLFFYSPEFSLSVENFRASLFQPFLYTGFSKQNVNPNFLYTGCLDFYSFLALLCTGILFSFSFLALLRTGTSIFYSFFNFLCTGTTFFYSFFTLLCTGAAIFYSFFTLLCIGNSLIKSKPIH